MDLTNRAIEAEAARKAAAEARVADQQATARENARQLLKQQMLEFLGIEVADSEILENTATTGYDRPLFGVVVDGDRLVLSAHPDTSDSYQGAPAGLQPWVLMTDGSFAAVRHTSHSDSRFRRIRTVAQLGQLVAETLVYATDGRHPDYTGSQKAEYLPGQKAPERPLPPLDTGWVRQAHAIVGAAHAYLADEAPEYSAEALEKMKADLSELADHLVALGDTDDDGAPRSAPIDSLVDFLDQLRANTDTVTESDIDAYWAERS